MKIQPTRCLSGCSWGSLRSQRRQELVISAYRPVDLARWQKGESSPAGGTRIGGYARIHRVAPRLLIEVPSSA
jgi:hypothetical protein